jgi:hypothetical protein
MAGKLRSSLLAVRHNISHGTILEQDLQYWTNEDSQKPHIVSSTATKLLFRVQCHLLQSLYPTAVKTNMGKLSYLHHTTILTQLKHVSLFPPPFSSVTITLQHLVVSQHTDWELKGRIKEKFTHIWEETIFEVLTVSSLVFPIAFNRISHLKSILQTQSIVKSVKEEEIYLTQKNAMLVA